MIEAMRQFIGPNQMMAYLVMMAARLVELHRVLKPTGSLYLHCDPTASHYLKVVLDIVFGPQNYRNEIVWKRTSTSQRCAAQVRRCYRHYLSLQSKARPTRSTRNSLRTLTSTLRKFYRYVDTKGRRYRLR